MYCLPSELEEGVAEGVAVAGPLGVVELDHLPLLAILPQPRQQVKK